MKITEDVRKFAAEKKPPKSKAPVGFERKAREFIEKGSESSREDVIVRSFLREYAWTNMF